MQASGTNSPAMDQNHVCRNCETAFITSKPQHQLSTMQKSNLKYVKFESQICKNQISNMCKSNFNVKCAEHHVFQNTEYLLSTIYN